MYLVHYPLAKLSTQITSVVSKYLPVSEYKVFFFGSRVTGKGNDRSDIDIGIEGPNPIPLETMSCLREEIENLPTLYKIEIVDFKEVSPDFYRVATAHREYL